ncbi:MAG: NYN domain-containing protein [Rubricella sp.]
MTDTQRIALLVDADNVEAENIRFAVEACQQRGDLVLRHAWGRVSAIKGRERVLGDLGFAAHVALPASRARKDTADLMLAQAAVRFAERDLVDIIAIASSDSDFVVIAQGIAEAGKRAIGFGRANTPSALKEACAEFVTFPDANERKESARAEIGPKDFAKLERIIRSQADKRGEVRMQTLGTMLNRSFGGDYRKHFGVKTLAELLADLDDVTVEGQGLGATIRVAAKG